MSPSSHPEARDIDEMLAALSSGSHRAGTLKLPVLRGIIDLLPSREIHSVETGCGKSTIVLSNIAKHHLSFCYDDRDVEDSSVGYVLGHRYFLSERTSFVFGPTQITLPQHNFANDPLFDLVLIDGPHGFPFPDLEYWHLYPRLAPGGLLVIDDLMIPSIGRMYDILREDRMFEEVAVLATTGILRRSHEPALPRDGDHWWEQAHNFRRFPLTMQPYKRDSAYSLGTELNFSDKAVFDRHCVRGFEFRAGNGAETIDTSAVLRFKCGAAGAQLRLRLRFSVTSLDDCAGGGVHANDALVLAIPANTWEVDVEFSCSVDPNGDCRVEFRLPLAKPIHDTRKNLNFRRTGLTLRKFSARSSDESDASPIFHLGAPIEGAMLGQLMRAAPSTDIAVDAVAFISAIDELCDRAVVPMESTTVHEVVPPPILCPNVASAVRFLPLRGVAPNRDESGSSWMLPISGKRWTFVDFFAFEGEEFSYAVLRSLLHCAPNKRQVQIGHGSTTDKLLLVLESDYRARKVGGLGKFNDLPLTRAVYRLWRMFQKHKLSMPAAALMRLIKGSAENSHKMNRRRLRERRLLLDALSALSGKRPTN